MLTELYEDNSCFYKIDNLANRFFVHHARIYENKEITSELKKYMVMAYGIGNGEHITKKQKTMLSVIKTAPG